MKCLVTALLFVFSATAFAGPKEIAKLQIPLIGISQTGGFGIPAKDIPSLERTIKKAASAETGWEGFKDFKVDWTPSSLACTRIESEMAPHEQLGVCTVDFHAWQVVGKAVIIKKYQGYAVSIVYADIE